jgi:hypothetical protein
MIRIQCGEVDRTAEELCERFGGITEDTVRVTGTWKYGGRRYRDTFFRIRVDTTDPVAPAFFKAQKEIRKERFRQLDIWIAAHQIDIL